MPNLEWHYSDRIEENRGNNKVIKDFSTEVEVGAKFPVLSTNFFRYNVCRAHRPIYNISG